MTVNVITLERKLELLQKDSKSTGVELVLLNLTGKDNLSLQKHGFRQCDTLQVRNAWDSNFDGNIGKYLVQQCGLRSGQQVVAALPMHIQLRDALLVGIYATTGNFPVVVHAAGEGERCDFSRYRDLNRARKTIRGLRPNVVHI